ncbi:hypothetical protein GCM10028805_23470 [Spirosoma harenae]
MRLAISGLISLFLLNSQRLPSQNLGGNWVGVLSSPKSSAVSLQSTLLLRISAQEVTGELRVQSGDKQDQYSLKGIANGQKIQGTAIYPADGSVFQFEGQLQNEKLLFAIGQNGAALMVGALARKGNETASNSPIDQAKSAESIPSDKNLYRDPNLIGAWRTESNYGGGITDGGFYGNTSSTMLLKADGTFGDGGSSGYASGSGVSVQSSGEGNKQLYAQLAAAQARWFTKGNVFYIRLNVNGKWQDVPSANYYIENGKVLLTDLKTGKKTLYYKVE